MDDDSTKIGTKIAEYEGFKVIGDVNTSIRLAQEDPNLEFIIAVGNNGVRKRIADKYDLKYYTAISPSANIGFNVKIEEGTVIMPNVCINPSASIGKHCIINTGAIVEHDSIVKSFVHISPNAALAGTVVVGENTHIGIGANVINNVSINSNCVIGAGAVVINDISESGTYVGVPAKKIK